MRVKQAHSLLTLVVALTLVACAGQNPFTYASTNLDKAHVALRSLEVVQTEVLALVNDPAVPVTVTAALRVGSRYATEAATQVGGAVVEFEAARAALGAGETSSDRLRIASANLVAWTTTLQARIASIKAVAKGAK